MFLYDSLSRTKKPLPYTGRKPLRLFVCGPTVYDYAHLGHARTYLTFDFFVRHLRESGRKVFYLQNITNVDDKIIDRAARDGKRPLTLAKTFEAEYRKDMKTLRIAAVDRYARASDFISDIVRQVQTLLRKGHAYKIEGDGYYFDIQKFKRYGALSGRTAAQAEDAVSRIDDSVKKRNRGDFALWKFSKPGEPAWKTPLGEGRPGWHIEDTAISEHFFGPQYDVHGGGVDLKFPHHESEIAQQEAASGKRPFVKVWMHAGTLLVDGKKMAKSAGNFITIREFVKTHNPAVLRWLVLQHHYRSPVNYTPALAAHAERAVEKLRAAVAEYKSYRTSASDKSNKSYRTYKERFNTALDDDLNTPKALAVLWNTLEDPALPARLKLSLLLSYDEVLGLGLKNVKKEAAIPASVAALARERELCRVRKQFTHADALRAKINALGYRVEDTASGPRVRKVK